jgi:hypothetical protein
MSDGTTGRRTKVVRVIDEYGLDGKGAELEAAWTGEVGERKSLRDIADDFNEAVLEAALKDAGVSPISFKVTGTYESLQEDAEPDATRVRRRLEREGVNPDAVSRDFVTHQAIHTYLTKDRKASIPEGDENAIERKVETIEKLEGRVAAVTESAVAELAAADKLDGDDYAVIIDVRVVCPNCGSGQAVGDLFQRGGCDCSADTTIG